MVATDQRENHQAREQGSKTLKLKDPEEAKPQGTAGRAGVGLARLHQAGLLPQTCPRSRPPPSALQPQLLGTGEAVLFSKTPQRCHNPGMMSKLLQE